MLRDIVSIGDKIDVKHLDHTGKLKNNVTCVSQLLDFVEDDIISIAMPLLNGHMVFLEVGEKYSLCFYTGKGLYQCSAEMISSYRENNAVIAALKLSSDLEKFQRRQYYRLECIHEILYRVITPKEISFTTLLSLGNYKTTEERAEIRRKLAQMDQQWEKASIIDLSGGGCRFNSDYMHDPGDRVKIKLDFILGNEMKKLVIGADIIYSGKLLNRLGKYEHRAEFVNIGKNDREDLIKYIFEQDRKRRKNGKV
ncbi:flagellar brake protein [Mobilitalea sibirica]|uniref:Flagellar brake protein n=1 Tax=Mobilitalea sibirica TaxID=1462919 RepID=A0A8J7L382_9FIRM|nr:flagellar brake protein [Mobilitalea sibirica]MBH1942008.1 flagellar brake protein [Mobilitalea sibirica]